MCEATAYLLKGDQEELVLESVDLLEAIETFNSRERRFGKTSEQIRGEET